MTHQSIREKFLELENEWHTAVENWNEVREESKNEDLFAAISYLTLTDQMSKTINQNLNAIALLLKELSELRKKSVPAKEAAAEIKELFTEMENLRNRMHKKMHGIDLEYPLLSESTLRLSQDLISKYSIALEREKTTANIAPNVNQNLDKELFLQELKDSLEGYREAREAYVSENFENTIQKLPHPEGSIPEDLGEEDPEVDFVLSELDMAITACDSALLLKEITD